MRIRPALILLTCLFTLLPHSSLAADIHPFNLPDGFTQDVLAKDLGPATSFAFRPDGSILIARKHGSVKVYRDGKILEAPFIDISGELSNYGDRGLMGIAVHPDYPTRPYIYLAYAYEPGEAKGHAESGARAARVIRVETDSRNPDKARDGSKVVLLGANGTPDHMGDLDRGDRPPYSCMTDGQPVVDCLPVDGPSHTVDDLVFGPDGALYVSAGDGTLQPDLNVRAQNVDSLAGKILRINPLTGAGYADNPFYDGDPNSNRSKVYALGLRNPYRFTFDPGGQLVVGDVGGERWEEINRGDPGANFGWPCLEGALPNSGDPACAAVLSGATATTPAWHSYAHADGYSAAIGGDFYTGDKYPAAYQGAYFFADHNHAALLYLPAGAGSGDGAQEFATNVIAPVQISMGPDGSLYVLSFVDGTLSRIRYTGDGSEPAPAPTATATPAAAEPAGEPTVRILAPEDGSKWAENEDVDLRGEAADVDGKTIGGEGLQWTATLHHNDHIHPDFFHGAGAHQTFRFEPHAPNIYYELCLTATDSEGRSASTCVNIYQAKGGEAESVAETAKVESPKPETATADAGSSEAGSSAAEPAAATADVAVTSPAAAAADSATVHGVQRERWLDVGGAKVADLTQHAGFPAKPDKVEVLPTLETGGDGKDYGERLSGYLTPPADGDYLFWIAADDSGELWLSTDADPANAVQIAATSTWTPKRDWDKSPTQASAPISLKGGRRYYIEARHKQADQKDNLSVAWQRPGGERGVIDTEYLTPD
ncbi:MAG: PQQ-dependent sugar dehydrogenase [Caldilineaceae bacterium]